MADDQKQSKAHDLLRRTFGNTPPMQSDERLMQGAGEQATRPRHITPLEYAEHMEGRSLTEDELQGPSRRMARLRSRDAQVATATSARQKPQAYE